MTYYVGIDIAKYTHFASIITSSGEVIEAPFSFDNNKSGFNLLLSKLHSLDTDDILCGYESTAHYHLNLHQFLQFEHSFHCVIINPILTKRFRGLNIRDVKNDKFDSLNIAQFLSFNYSNILYSNQLSDLYVLCLEHHNLKQHKAKLYTQLTACLDVVFPELKQSFFKGNLKTIAAHNLLKRYSSAEDIACIRIDALHNLISKGSKRFNRKRVESLKSLASNSVGINSSAYKLKVSNLIQHIELIERQIEDITTVIINDNIVKDSALLSIPGMGYIQAAYILSVINSIERFDTPKQVLAYAGLDPKVRQSGQFSAVKTRMSKRGNTLLRYALVWSSNNLRKNSKTMNTYYLKKRREGKFHYNALGHCSKKLVNYIFWILNNPDKDFILE